ncbi:MAG: capsule biosynthesis protein [Candidatus Adiutrix sp.]|nr:capsule biosynthesis protein [Candidatus Adiutrix sp.]
MRNIQRRFHENLWTISLRRFFLLTLSPALLVFIYTALLASPMYISMSKFAIRNMEAGGGLVGGFDLIQQFVGRGDNSTAGDSYLIAQYVVSWDIFSKIDARLGLKEHFQDTGRDLISRLSGRATQEDILDYWAWVVKLDFDRDTGLISCQVKAYTPEMAQRINKLLIEYSEALINEMNRRGHQDSLDMAQAEVKTAEERLSRAHAAMRQMREKTTHISAQTAAETLQTIIVNLEVEAAKTAAELKEARAYMRDDSPAVETLKRRLSAINDQLASERGKLSGMNAESQDREYFSAVVGALENMQLEEEFARQQYTAALATLEAARIRSDAKNRYLVAFEPPLLPDESLYPPILKSTFLTFLGTMLLLGLGSLITAAVREHAGF